MKDIVEDINTLTSIPRANIAKLMQKISWLITNAVYESKQKGEDLTELNLNFGKLYILKSGDKLKYRFQPSKKLESALIDVFTKDTEPVAEEAENAVTETLLRAYKELM